MLMAKRRKKAKAKGPFALKLIRLRQDHGNLTQAEAATRTRVALRTWISWENDQRVPSGPALELLKIAFPGEEF